MSNTWLIAIVIGSIIIAGLAFYAGKLLMLLKAQTKQQKGAHEQHQRGLKNHDKKVFDSVVIIARAMQEEQCDISEGCWRLSVLLDSLKISQGLDQQFPAIFELYNKIKHLAILTDRKDLEKKQRMKEDLTRMKAESELADEIKLDIDLLHQYAIERISVLKNSAA